MSVLRKVYRTCLRADLVLCRTYIMQAIQLQHTEYLAALVAVVLLLALFVVSYRWRKRAMKRFGQDELLRRLNPFSSPTRRFIKWLLGTLALAMLVVSWANPLVGRQKQTGVKKGIDIVLAIDISRSMLAEDVKPSRLERARQFVVRLVDELQGDRIGLILFAGRAYRQLPLTTDHALVKMFVRNMNTELAPSQGTAIGEAISLAVESYSGEERKPMALVIISDGEDHEPGAAEMARQAAESGMTVYAIGIGTARGAPIPEYFRGQMIGYKADAQGNIVLSKLNETELSMIASEGNGTYMPFTGSPDQVRSLRNEFDLIKQREYEEVRFDEYATWYQIPLAFALLLLMIEVIIVETRRNWMARIKLFRA